MLTFRDTYQGESVEYGVDPNAHPVVNTLTIAGLTWRHRPYSTRQDNIVATWETAHNGAPWWLFGSPSNSPDGKRMWHLRSSAGVSRRHPEATLLQAAALWAGRDIAGPGPSHF